jgi:hypothetical protein
MIIFFTSIKTNLPRISMSGMSDIQHFQSIHYAYFIHILMFIFDLI